MAPAQINTTKPFPAPRRTSTESSPSMSALSSPTSPTSTTAPTSAGSDASTSFFTRIRSARSRSPTRRHTVGSPTAATTPAVASPTSAKRPSIEQARSDSAATLPAEAHVRPRPAKRHSSTTMQCGRHSNDWLFGGFSITDTVKELLHRADEEK